MSLTNGLIRYGLACAMVGWATVGRGEYFWQTTTADWSSESAWTKIGSNDNRVFGGNQKGLLSTETHVVEFSKAETSVGLWVENGAEKGGVLWRLAENASEGAGLTMNGYLTVGTGSSSHGELTIESGAYRSENETRIGDGASGGLLTVTGGSLYSRGDLVVGKSGPGRMVISGTGVVTVPNDRWSKIQNANNSIELVAGGTFVTPWINGDSGKGQHVDFKGGVLKKGGNVTNQSGKLVSSSITLNVYAEGGTIEVENTTEIGSPIALQEEGGVLTLKVPGKTLTLTGCGTYTGGLSIASGTVVVPLGMTVATLEIAEGAVLAFPAITAPRVLMTTGNDVAALESRIQTPNGYALSIETTESGSIISAVPLVVAGAYHWNSSVASGSWKDKASWVTVDGEGEAIPASAYPGDDEEVWFDASATVTLDGDVSVKTLHVAEGADVTLSGAQTVSLEEADGLGTVVLTKNARLRARSAGGTVNTSLRIDGTARLVNSGANLDVYGSLLGTGTVTLQEGGSYKGVRLYGDNSAFAGTVVVDGGANRAKFGAASAGSAQATFRVAAGTDNGSMLFNEGTISFGEFLAPNGANVRVPDRSGLHTYEIGGKNTDFNLGTPDFYAAALTKIVKVGTGKMTFAPRNYGTLEVREGVAEWNSTSAGTLPVYKLSFTGGTFRYGEAAGTDDVSALIKDSTAAVRIDTNGKDVRFETPLAASNAGGLEKSGAGCLTLTAAPAAVGPLAVRGGVLAVAAGGAFTSVALAEGCRLEILADPVTWTGGTEQTLFTYASLEDGTELTKDNVIIKGLSDNVTTEISFEDGTVKATVTAEPLVWNGDNGADWSTAEVWKGGSSGAAKSFATLDVVAFDGSAFAGATLPQTNLVGLASSVEPSAVSVDLPSGFGYKLSGEGLLTTPRFTMNGPGSFAVDCDLALKDLDLNGGVFALSGERAYTLPSPSGAGVLAVDDAASVTFGDQMLSMSESGWSLAGAGTLRLGQGTFTARDSQLENFTGTIDVPTGAVLSDHIVSDTANFGSARIRLSGGAIDVRAVNLTTDNDIELVEGTESQFFGGNANYTLRGGLSGTGTVVFNTDQRGFQFRGDNSGFAGTAVLKGGPNYMSLGFYTPSAGSALARWTLDSENGANRDGSWRTLRIEGTRAAEPLHLGAFNVTKAGAMVQCANNPTCVVVGERNEDCAIEGGFNLNKIELKKAGSATLTLGTNCTMIAASTVTVASGTLEVNATNLVTATIIVQAGATLTGAGTVGSISFAPGAKVSFPDFDPATADRTKTYPGVKAESFYGKPTVEGGEIGNGQWRAVVVDGRLCARYRKSGLVIILE